MRGGGGGKKRERLPSIRRVKRAAGGCHGNMPLRNGKKKKTKIGNDELILISFCWMKLKKT